MKEGTPKTIYLKDYQPPSYWIPKAALRFELYDDKTLVHAVLRLEANAAAVCEGPLHLNGEQLKLRRIYIDDKPLTENEYHISRRSLHS